MQDPALTISRGKLRFNTACLRKFQNVEYVELLLNSANKTIAIRPCEKSNPNAIRWGRLKNERWAVSTLSCRGLSQTLFDMEKWDEEVSYRLRGQFVARGKEKLMLFELDEPEMLKKIVVELPPVVPEEKSEEETEEKKEATCLKETILIYPDEWRLHCGRPLVWFDKVNFLKEEQYSGNWVALRPATEIIGMSRLTNEDLADLMSEADEIMERWA